MSGKSENLTLSQTSAPQHGYLDDLWLLVTDPVWWTEQVLVWFVFSLTVSGIILWGTRRREAKERAPFEGWTLHVIGYSEYTPQKIDWNEVRRFKSSDFELWKFAKSVVSGVCNVTPLTAAPAREEGWLEINGKRIIIDFTKLPEKHVAHFHSTAAVPHGWTRVDTRVVRKDIVERPE